MAPATAPELSWFRKPAGVEPGTLNATYQLLDRVVIAGGGDEPALLDESGAVSHAVLLAEVAELGGALRSCGVGPGVAVVFEAGTDRRAVTALLALARVGAVVWREEDGSAAAAPPRIDADEIIGISWDLARDLGRTDPAPAEELAADAPWTTGNTAYHLAKGLIDVQTPIDPVALTARLLRPRIER